MERQMGRMVCWSLESSRRNNRRKRTWGIKEDMGRDQHIRWINRRHFVWHAIWIQGMYGNDGCSIVLNNTIQNWIDRKEMELLRKVYLTYLNLKAAFDCVDKEELMKVMREIGFEEDLSPTTITVKWEIVRENMNRRSEKSARKH